ncbi:MAG TPA: hypothetical protein VHS74_12100 [Solirubrobacterales bacterium]|jgi:hypothetical protein|nr:hypothetical protein [Solirubrobacterales bacterium]
MRRLFLAALALLAVALLPTSARASDGYTLTGLWVSGGAVWHADGKFVLGWDPNPADKASVVHWAIADATTGKAFAFGSDPERLNGTTVTVPAHPGVYLFEADNWQTNVFGPDEFGPVVKVPLYFDDARPQPVSVTAPTWVAAGTVVPIRLSHPAGPLPVSGIEGYAVSIDGLADGAPCARADRCAAGEVDLTGGVGQDSTSLPAPPEGISYVHAVAVSGSGMASTGTGTVEVGVDGTAPRVRLEGAPAGWAAGPLHLSAVAADELSGMEPAGPGGPITAIGVDGAPPTQAPGPEASATVAGEGSHQVVFWARDAVGNAGDGSLPFAHPETATVRIDETAPTVRFAAADPDDPERIEAIVGDALSGPSANRGEIALRPAGTTGSFQPLPTAVEPDRLVARWSSDDFPHGPYEFRATGFDAAGNSATNRDGGGATFVLQNPVKREAKVDFGFGAAALVYPRCARADGHRRCRSATVRSFAKRPPNRTVPCCHGAVVGGRLLDAAGDPLPGQAVEVVETFAPGSRTRTRGTPLITDADGYFHARLAPGPSRVVKADFAGTRHLTRAAGRSLRLRVRAAVRMTASTSRVLVGGAPVVFKGRIVHPEAPIPVRGLPVELEFQLPGMPWTEFRTVQSDAAGRFAYPYSFSDDDSAGVRFLFRAFVPATGNWPFVPATSRPVPVTG